MTNKEKLIFTFFSLKKNNDNLKKKKSDNLVKNYKLTQKQVFYNFGISVLWDFLNISKSSKTPSKTCTRHTKNLQQSFCIRDRRVSRIQRNCFEYNY